MSVHLSNQQIPRLRPFLTCMGTWILTGAVLLIFEEDRGLFKFFNGLHNPFLDRLMPLVTRLGEGLFIICVCLTLFFFRKYRNWKFLVLLTACVVLPFLVVQAIKHLVLAPRPIAYFNQADWIHLVEGQTIHRALSFPSGHSTGIFAMVCLFSILLPRRFSWLGPVLFVLALIVGISRIYLAQHFFLDVYVGSIIGTTVTLFVFNFLQSRLSIRL